MLKETWTVKDVLDIPEPTTLPLPSPSGSSTAGLEPESGTYSPVFDLDELVHEVRGPLSTASIALEALGEDPRAREVLTASLGHLQDLLASLSPAKEGPTLVVEHLPTAVMIADPHGRVALDLRVEMSARVCCTPVRFRQLIVNLVSNALKFSHTSTTVKVTAVTHNDQVVISIADHGKGMGPGDAELIFERGIRGHAHDTVPGDGLGLTIVRRLARSCGGDARLASSDLTGTTFVITLPLLH